MESGESTDETICKELLTIIPCSSFSTPYSFSVEPPLKKDPSVEMGTINVEIISVSSKHCFGCLFSSRSISISAINTICSSLLFQGSQKYENGRMGYT